MYTLTSSSSRRDGSPFVNLLMMAPLCDSRGKIRYFIGAQVDVSGLVKDCTDMESLERLVAEQNDEETQSEQESHQNGDQQNPLILNLNGNSSTHPESNPEEKDEFRSLSEMFNMGELSTVRKYGGRMHTDRTIDDNESIMSGHKPRLLLREPSPDHVMKNIIGPEGVNGVAARSSGKLSGVYKHVSCLLTHPPPLARSADLFFSVNSTFSSAPLRPSVFSSLPHPNGSPESYNRTSSPELVDHHTCAPNSKPQSVKAAA